MLGMLSSCLLLNKPPERNWKLSCTGSANVAIATSELVSSRVATSEIVSWATSKGLTVCSMISNAELWRVRPQWRNTNSTRKGQVWPEQTFWRVCNPEFYLLEKERVKLVLLDRSIQASALGAQRLIVTSPTIPMRSRIVHELYPCRSQPLVFIIHATWAYITYYLSLSAHNVTKMFAFLLVLYPKNNRIVFF